MPLMTPLPFNLQVPIAGLVLAIVSWLLLDTFGRRFRSGSLRRGLLLSSRQSIPLSCALVGVICWLLDLLDPSLIQFPRDGVKAFGILVVIGLSWTLLSWKKELKQNQDSYATQMLQGFGEKDRLFLFDVVQKTIGIAAMVILCLEVMHLMGISPAVLVTAGGVGAVALGFGAKGIVSNSLSGLSLYINRPFVVSDFIDIPSENLSGNVEHIGWFYTKLRSSDRQPVYIPNNIFTSKPVVNIADIDNRRIWIEFGVNYGDRRKIESIVSDLQQVLVNHSDVDQSKKMAVNFTGYGDSSLNLRLVCYSSSGNLSDAWALQQRLLLKIGDVVEVHGAGMPFPTRTLIHSGSNQKPQTMNPLIGINQESGEGAT